MALVLWVLYLADVRATLYPTVSKKCATLIWANDFDEQTLRGGVLKTHIPS